MREAQRSKVFSAAGLHRGGDLVRRDAQPELCEVDAVEALGEPHQRGVAVGADLADDGAHGDVDILRHLAFGGEQRGESSFEIRAPAVEAQGHASSSPGERGGTRSLSFAPPRCKARSLAYQL